MKYVEQKGTKNKKQHSGISWAAPLRQGARLDVKQEGDELIVTGVMPFFAEQDRSSDLLWQYENARKDWSIGKGRTGKNSPHIRFANADTDAKLISFVRRFGPVVARSVNIVPGSANQQSQFPDEGPAASSDRPLLKAWQVIQELKSEQVIYSAALGLIFELARPISYFDFLSAKNLIGRIAAHVDGWSRQWEREREERKREPSWRLGADSIKRIHDLSSGPPDVFLPPILDLRITICELINAFRPMAFPNPLEMHASIWYGIRPLLYAILRREFLNPRDVGVCANKQCREFFEVERAGQRFCTAECSLHQRQREYWQERGSKLRKKRLLKNKKEVKPKLMDNLSDNTLGPRQSGRSA